LAARRVAGREWFTGPSATNRLQILRFYVHANFLGRKSGRWFDFLNVVNPALTLFRNADSEHLAYGAWSYHGLDFMTNNQAGYVVVDTNNNPMGVYVTNELYARRRNPYTFYTLSGSQSPGRVSDPARCFERRTA